MLDEFLSALPRSYCGFAITTHSKSYRSGAKPLITLRCTATSAKATLRADSWDQLEAEIDSAGSCRPAA